jgi:hypothetical protein
MKITGTVKVKLNTGLARQKGHDVAWEATDRILKEVMSRAKYNVTPGIGPGPHPHITPHKDTGEGVKSIWGYINREQNGYIATFGTFLPYLLHLEYGYHSRAGRFVRYQWLEPAIQATQQEADEFVKDIARRYGLTLYGTATFQHVAKATAQPSLSGYGQGATVHVPVRSK